jgi:ParB family transcriptional regulator, chromosome partitioning protein
MNDDPIIRLSVPRRDAEEAASIPRRKPPALGRGLGALMGESRREQAIDDGDYALRIERGYALVSIGAIDPHPANPRRHFDDGALDELAASIAQRGVIQPIIVRPDGAGRYQLVAGERRWRAAQRAQLHEIPALVRELTDREVLALALIENLQREDLNPIEEARAYQRLAELESMTQADIAKMVDKSRSHVANLQRLLALPEPVIAMVETGDLSMGHARALIGVAGAEDIARKAVASQMSVREVEKLVRRESRGPGGTPRRARAETSSADAADIAAVQGHLEEFLGLPVRIAIDPDPRSGAVTIRYRTLDQLDLICQRLTGGGI